MSPGRSLVQGEIQIWGPVVVQDLHRRIAVNRFLVSLAYYPVAENVCRS